jgi:hypothetical protein
MNDYLLVLLYCRYEKMCKPAIPKILAYTFNTLSQITLENVEILVSSSMVPGYFCFFLMFVVLFEENPDLQAGRCLGVGRIEPCEGQTSALNTK